MVIIALLSALVLIGLDQAIKGWAVSSLQTIGTMPLIPDVLHLTYVENYGAAFSIMQNRKWFLVGVTGLVIVAALVALLSGKLKGRFLVSTVALILAGGAGNLIDRIVRGYVVDYIDFRLIHFPVFNLADCCVVVGTLLLAIYIIWLEPREKAKLAVQESPAEPPKADGGEANDDA